MIWPSFMKFTQTLKAAGKLQETNVQISNDLLLLSGKNTHYPPLDVSAPSHFHMLP